jgi:hypothetical protein
MRNSSRIVRLHTEDDGVIRMDRMNGPFREIMAGLDVLELHRSSDGKRVEVRIAKGRKIGEMSGLAAGAGMTIGIGVSGAGALAALLSAIPTGGLSLVAFGIGTAMIWVGGALIVVPSMMHIGKKIGEAIARSLPTLKLKTYTLSQQANLRTTDGISLPLAVTTDKRRIYNLMHTVVLNSASTDVSTAASPDTSKIESWITESFIITDQHGTRWRCTIDRTPVEPGHTGHTGQTDKPGHTHKYERDSGKGKTRGQEHELELVVETYHDRRVAFEAAAKGSSRGICDLNVRNQLARDGHDPAIFNEVNCDLDLIRSLLPFDLYTMMIKIKNAIEYTKADDSALVERLMLEAST